MSSAISHTLAMNRRAFLGRSGLGLMALASLLNPGLVRSAVTSKARRTGVVNPPELRADSGTCTPEELRRMLLP